MAYWMRWSELFSLVARPVGPLIRDPRLCKTHDRIHHADVEALKRTLEHSAIPWKFLAAMPKTDLHLHLDGSLRCVLTPHHVA